jgi:hypothetical protein
MSATKASSEIILSPGRRLQLRSGLLGGLVLVLALSARLLYLSEIDKSPFYDVRYWKGTDSYNFFVWALQIAAGAEVGEGIYAIQAPLYPYFLAAVFKLGGGNLLVPRFIQLFLGSFTALLAFLLGRRLKGPLAGLMAGLICAFYGPLIFYEGAILRDGLATFLYLVFIYSLVKARERPGLSSGSLLGLFFGLSILIKPNILVMVPVIGWSLWVWREPVAAPGDPGGKNPRAKKDALKGPVKLLAGLAIAGAAVMTPLAIKNVRAGDPPFQLSRNSSFTLIAGNHPTTMPTDFDTREVSFPNRININVRTLDEQTGGSNARALVAILGLYREKPSEFIRGQLAKVWLLIYGYVVPENFNYYVEKRYVRIMRLPWITWPPLLALALVGMVMTAGRWRDNFELYSYLALMSAGSVIFFVVGRYKVPLVPVMAAFAGAGTAGIMEAAGKGRWKSATVAILASLVIGAVSWPRVADPFRYNDYRNLVLYHAMKKEPEAARQWAREGREEAERVLLETGSAKARYRLAQMKYLCGDPLPKVEAELKRARAMSPPPWLLDLIESLEKSCRLRRQWEDLKPGGFRF